MHILKLFFLLLCLFSASIVSAGSITILQSTEGDFNLKDFSSDLVSGDIRKKESYFTGVSFSESASNIFDSPLSSIGLSQESEYQLSKHYGYGFDDILEVSAARILRSGNIGLVHGIGVNFFSGLGLSYTLDDPVFEQAVDGKWYRLQSHILFGAEFNKSDSDYSIPIRIHHRSGSYGLIAPRKVGSNFISVGLKINI